MSYDRLKLNSNTLKNNLPEYSESKLLTISSGTSLSGAIAVMSQNRSSYLLIEAQNKLAGIFTERDLVGLIAAGTDFAGKTIGEVMTEQPIVLSHLDNLSLLKTIDIFRQHRVRHLPLVDASGKAVGMITHSSLRQKIQGSYLLKQKKVRESMKREVVSITGDRTIIEIARLLTAHRVSCVVIVENSQAEKLSPVGIVTERDLVQFKTLNLDLYNLPICQVMSSPLFAIGDDLSLQDARNLMLERHTRRLVVTDGDGFLAGIITQTSILNSLDLQEVCRVLEFLEDLVEKKTEELKIEKAIEIEQKQKLEINQRYLQTVLSGINEIVLIVAPDDGQTSFLSANLSSGDRLRDKLIRQTRARFEKPKTRQTFFDAAREAIAARQKTNFEYSIDLLGRGQFCFSAQIYPLPDNTAVWIARDITLSKQQEVHRQPNNIAVEAKENGDRELKTANKLLQQQIAFLLNYSPQTNKYPRKSWLRYLLPFDNQLGLWLNNLQRHHYPAWTGAVITLAIALIIESSRRAGTIVPVPFMLLIIAVSSSASLGGVLAGLWSHLVWSLSVVYAAIVGFGPETLTGGNIQVTAGIGIMAIFAVIQGWSKEQNRWLTSILKHQNHQLQQEIALRTQDLATTNADLKIEIQERIATQEALANSEQKFRTIFENAQVGIVVSNLHKKFLQVNPKFCQFTGYDAEELQTMTFAQISHPNERLSDSHHVKQMRNSNFDTLVKEKRYIHKNGSIIWGNITATTVKNEQNQPDYFIAIIQDITKRKQAELALQESEIRFYSLLDACSFLIWISGIDGLCSFFNTSWLNFTGRTLEQELGLGWSEGVHPEDLDFCLEIYETAFARQEPFKMEHRLRQRNGKYAWILGEGVPRFRTDGSFAGYIGTCVDISDRIQAKQEKEQLLQKIDRERQFLESVLQQMPAGVVIAQAPSGKLILSNGRAAEIIQYSQLPTIDNIKDYERVKTWHSQGTPRKLNEFAIVKALKGETTSGEEVDILGENGSKRTLFANAAPIQDSESNIIAAIATFYDITELKQAQAAKKDAENKSILLKEIHHRIKNNLQIVSALLDLQSEQIQDEAAVVLLEKSQARIQTMALIHEKLYSSKNLERIDFVEYITSLTGYLRDSFIQDFQRIKLTLKLEPTQLSLDLATPCGLIINELVVNSLEHGFGECSTGEITISFGRDRDLDYCLIVRDNGCGISDKIDLDNNTQFLGLSLVKSLVEKQLKGTWEIQQNQGCVIKITFPHI